MERDDHDEVLRARQRLHKVESSVAGLRYALRALTDEVEETRDFCAKYGPLVDGMIEANKRAAELAEYLKDEREQRTAFFSTVWGRMLATVTVAAAVGSFVLQLVHL